MKVAIITANTDIYKGREENSSGEAIRKMIEEAGFETVFLRALPLDREVLSAVMQRIADGRLADLILTTGGAGCAPQDCTPEATTDIVERPVLGIAEAMRAHTMKLTKRSMLNRSTAGIRNGVLIVNLSGKTQAVKESLRYLLPELAHAVEVIQKED